MGGGALASCGAQAQVLLPGGRAAPTLVWARLPLAGRRSWACLPNTVGISKAEQRMVLECVDLLTLWVQVKVALCSRVSFVPLCGHLNMCLSVC